MCTSNHCPGSSKVSSSASRMASLIVTNIEQRAVSTDEADLADMEIEYCPSSSEKAETEQDGSCEVSCNGSSTDIKENKKRKHQHHIVVQHNYHDHSSDSILPEIPDAISTLENSKNRGGVVTPFPQKLYELLLNVEQDGFDDVISWQPHGRCFKIHKPDRFKAEILPRYFPKLSKIASFQRQLNLYGFTRLAKQGSLDKCGYYHELFLRGRLDLLQIIHRIKVKGTGIRAKSNPEQEPDFWSMPWVGQSEDNGSEGMTDKTTSTPSASDPSSIESKQDEVTVPLHTPVSARVICPIIVPSNLNPCYTKNPEILPFPFKKEQTRLGNLPRNVSITSAATEDISCTSDQHHSEEVPSENISCTYDHHYKEEVPTPPKVHFFMQPIPSGITVAQNSPGPLIQNISYFRNTEELSSTVVSDTTFVSLNNYSTCMDSIDVSIPQRQQIQCDRLSEDCYALLEDEAPSIDFDKLLDGMFNSNEHLDFAGLLKKAIL